MINVCPIGRNCSQAERDEFEQFDNEHNIRKAMIKVLQEEFSDFGLNFAIGGQISFDVYPQGEDRELELVLDDFRGSLSVKGA